MIILNCFQSEPYQKEILPENFAEFPYICIYTDMDRRIDRCIPWHWHPSFELDFVAEGELEIQTSEKTLLLRKGDLVFVNSGVMHQLQSGRKSPGCKIYAHIFEMEFLSGIHSGLLEQKYILPVLRCRELDSLLIRPNCSRGIRMIEKILSMHDLNIQEPAGYEFELRALLCRFWCLLLEETEDLVKNSTRAANADIERMKTMMQYIHNHYSEKITLEQIAASASVSARECCRCFQRCINMSPVNYLNEYRVRMAAQLLLQTGDNILSVSEQCGFSSGSYFGKIFQKVIGCTPRDYRRGNYGQKEESLPQGR